MKFDSFREFYPYYLAQHSNLVCRRFHLVGTFLVILFGFLGVLTLNWLFFGLMPIAGYGCAWTGHFFFEKNESAAFRNPFYSLAADFVMFWPALRGQLSMRLASSQELYPKD